jgi:hypothetical protein
MSGPGGRPGRCRNLWSTRSDPPFAQWEMRFAPPETEGDLGRLLELARGILAAGERAEVYRVVQTPAPFAFRAAAGWTYADFLASILESTGSLPLFDLGSGVAPTPDGQLITPGKVGFYDPDGQLVQSEVNDLGALLERVRPSELPEWSQPVSHVAPVTILGRSVSPIARGPRPPGGPRPVRVVLSLLTDLWFPWVFGTFLGEQPPQPQPRLLYDNRELASCHTPRLNRFLSEARRLAEGAGGEWRCSPPEGSAEHYARMVGEESIRTDVTPVGYTLL